MIGVLHFSVEVWACATNFKDYDLSGSFIADLTAMANAFEASFSNTAAATTEHIGATAQTGESIHLGMVAKRILDGVVQNRYNSDPGKLVAWLSASDVENAPTK